PAVALGAGIILWCLIFYLLPRPVRAYVLAHELTHALWGALGGARVSGLRVAARGGSVRLSTVNWVSTLAPYFFPLYTFLIVLAYYLLALLVDLRRRELLWFGLLGLSLGFHWTFTIEALSRPQSDIRRYGKLFAYPLIYLLNLLGLALLLLLVAPVTPALLVTWLRQDTIWALRGCFLGLSGLWQWLALSRLAA
ncbi:MAG: hypothetical protein GX806_05000, partial [Lentisphaerae bacterium]|nr:hypothetical protein [Lentisphaerota bacterium]